VKPTAANIKTMLPSATNVLKLAVKAG